MRGAKAILGVMASYFPPSPKHPHTLHLEGDHLALTMHVGPYSIVFYFEERDLTRPYFLVADDVAKKVTKETGIKPLVEA